MRVGEEEGEGRWEGEKKRGRGEGEGRWEGEQKRGMEGEEKGKGRGGRPYEGRT